MSLIGTAEVRQWLGLAEGDKEPNDKIATLIDAVEDYVEGACNRKFEAQLYKTDVNYCYLDGTGMAFLYLPQYPVWYVNEVIIDADRNFPVGYLIGTDDIILYEQEGRIVSEAGYFTKGKKNVRVEFYAGFASGSHTSHFGEGLVQFPVPTDLKQTVVEMVSQLIKDGVTTLHSPQQDNRRSFEQMVSSNSFWKGTINSYKNFSAVANYGYYL
jgi:hypothetical protein